MRKDFPQQLGVGIVITGFVASTVAWYYHRVLLSFGVLFATALIDVILYVVMGNVLECYRCHAQYRGLASLEGHAGFDLEIHEKYRQQAARMKSADVSSVTEFQRHDIPLRGPALAEPADARIAGGPASRGARRDIHVNASTGPSSRRPQ